MDTTEKIKITTTTTTTIRVAKTSSKGKKPLQKDGTELFQRTTRRRQEGVRFVKKTCACKSQHLYLFVCVCVYLENKVVLFANRIRNNHIVSNTLTTATHISCIELKDQNKNSFSLRLFAINSMVKIINHKSNGKSTSFRCGRCV